MRSRSSRLLAPAVLALAVLAGAPASALVPASTDVVPAAGTAPETTIRPATLERGADPAVPQLLGKTILDGDVRVEVAAQEVQLLGRSGDEYVVLVYPRDASARLQRVAADGTRETIRTDVRGDVVLSRDGLQVLENVLRDGGARTVVTVRSAETGEREVRRSFRGHVRVLDADEERAVLGGSSPSRTLWWHTRTDGTSRISGREGYFADIRADRVATMSGTGEDLCSVLASLPPQAEVLWRSCRRAVVAAAPNGRRLVTTHVYSDGPVGSLQVHGDHGRLLASYDIAGSFGLSTWETGRAMLVQAYGTKKAAIVRCELGDCERASRRVDAP